MSVGISFGSATSGAGFDVTTTVASIMAIQRTPETAWATRTTALQTQDTALTALGTNVSALSTALSSLTSFDGVFASKGGATSNTDAVILTNVGNSASIASHTLTVSRLAQTSQYYSGAVASSSTLAGTLKLTIGGNETDLTIGSGSTVAQVAAQINSSSAGVKASVITDSNGSRLALTSATSGSAGELTVDSSALTNSGTSSAVSFTESQAGVDAAYTLDGASLTSSSNTISSALTGITFQLLGTTTSNVTLQIAADTSSVSTTIQSFVTAYNALTKALNAQEAKDSSGTAMPLFGNPVISQMQSGLATALNFTGSTSSSSTSSANAVSLSTLGLSVGSDGTLTLDSSALSAALSSKLDAVTSFFQNAGNFGQNFASSLETMGSSGTGAVALALKNNSDEESTLADNKTNLETRLSTYEANLTTELTTANEILQAIPTTLKGITALFNAITGNTSS